MITKLAFSGYRSLRDIVLPVMPLTVITGPNGSGKSNIYKALRLLADIAQGSVIRSLAQEGGLQTIFWAGPESFSRAMKRGEQTVQGGRRRNSASLKLGFAGNEFGYAIDLGYPPADQYQKHVPSAFNLDPEIKGERIWMGETLRPASLFGERKGPGVRLRDQDRKWDMAATNISRFDSMMTHCTDPQQAPELLLLREQMRRWRFYDHFRTDRDAPARRPQIGTFTPILGHDGSDLAAAIQTIREIGDLELLDRSVDHAFPGALLDIHMQDGYFELEMQQHGLLRPLRAAELSDGTLRYLLWIAALLTPRPPELLVLNEPETSLHPDLLEPLAELIVQAARNTQIIVVSHAERLVSALLCHSDCFGIELEKELGETRLNIEPGLIPRWDWPKR